MILYNYTHNDYLKHIYFDSISAYRTEILVKDDLTGVRNETILLDAEHLTPDMITYLKDNGNKIVAFDINDNSVFCYSYMDHAEIMDVDLIFKIAGIQKGNYSMDTVIGSDCSYSLVQKHFMSPENWSFYETLKKKDRIHSLPYVLWENYNVPNIPWKDRKKTVLVRGGHHYLRVHLLFNLIKIGMVDENSLFNTRGYFHQYCPICKKMMQEGRMTLEKVREAKSSCSLPKVIPPGYFQDRGDWNNGCPSRYFEMAEIMGVDRGLVENALNGNYVQICNYYDILNKYILYADLKWIFSIYAPPRFWEAAAAHTINLVPIRTNDQDYFPEMIDQEHYLTFSEDFEDLDLASEVYEKSYQRIVDNTYDLYDKWIKSGQYKLSTNLMDHIMSKIEGL
jgi:hypothetical protein